MSTPEVLVEVLVAGTQALAWLLLALLGLVGHIPRSLPPVLGGSILAGLGILAGAYTLGVVIDRVADTLLEGLENRVRAPIVEGMPPEPVMRLRVLATEAGAATFLNYQRSRIRIARATVLNSALLGVSGLAVKLWAPTLDSELLYGCGTWFALGGGLVGAGAALFAWWRINVSYTNRVVQSYRIALQRAHHVPQRGRRAIRDGT
jgi:hypothetical protein